MGQAIQYTRRPGKTLYKVLGIGHLLDQVVPPEPPARQVSFADTEP